MHSVLIVESDNSKRLLEELKGASLDAVGVPRENLIQGELGIFDTGLRFVDVTRVPGTPTRSPKVQQNASYRSLLKRKY